MCWEILCYSITMELLQSFSHNVCSVVYVLYFRHISTWTWPHFERSVATCGLWLVWWTAQLPTYWFCPDNSLFQKSVSIDTGGIQRNIMHFRIPEGDWNTIHTCQGFWGRSDMAPNPGKRFLVLTGLGWWSYSEGTPWMSPHFPPEAYPIMLRSLG